MVFNDRLNDRRNRPNSVGNTTGRNTNLRRTALNGMTFSDASTALSPNGPEGVGQLPALKRGRSIAVADVGIKTKTAQKYKNEEEDAEALLVASWRRIADAVGLHYDMIQAFNPDIKMTPMAKADPNQRIYVPTPSEVLFWQLCAQGGTGVTALDVRNDPALAMRKSPEGTSRFKSMAEEGRLNIVESARDRAAGETGDAYAKFSGAFYTPNDELSTQATAEVDGKNEKVARWGAYWKCNVFVNDSMDQAGQDSPLLSNKHYATAGSMWKRYTTKKGEGAKGEHIYDEIGYGEIQAGDIFVRYGGTGEASSHTEVITHKMGPHVFYATGAHHEGAYERRYITDSGQFEQAGKSLLMELASAKGLQLGNMTPDARAEFEIDNLDDVLESARVQELDKEDYRFLRLKNMKKG